MYGWPLLCHCERGMRRENTMKMAQQLATEAKAIVALAFRNGPIENLHAGVECPACKEDPNVSHISQTENEGADEVRCRSGLQALMVKGPRSGRLPGANCLWISLHVSVGRAEDHSVIKVLPQLALRDREQRSSTQSDHRVREMAIDFVGRLLQSIASTPGACSGSLRAGSRCRPDRRCDLRCATSQVSSRPIRAYPELRVHSPASSIPALPGSS